MHRERRQSMAGALALAGFLATTAAWAQTGGNQPPYRYVANMTGAEEVPPVTTEARAKGVFNFSQDFSRLRYSLKIRKGTGITSAHLHCAPAGVAGPIVVPLLSEIQGGLNRAIDLTASLEDANIVQTSGCTTADGTPIATLQDLAQAIQEGTVYVNVHSLAYPEGELRRQLGTDNGTGGGGNGGGGNGGGGNGGGGTGDDAGEGGA